MHVFSDLVKKHVAYFWQQTFVGIFRV